MHWLALLLLAWITGGIVGLIWTFRQAGFVKRIDPSSKARLLLVLTLLGAAAEIAIMLAGFTVGFISKSWIATVVGVAMCVNLLAVVLAYLAIFSMRKSVERYYNTVEPIGLRLSRSMTFFFQILYFQYHFSRIARWKKTGQLT